MSLKRGKKEMIELIATAESVTQGKALIDCGVDTLYIGEDFFGLRLPYSFSLEEIEELTTYAHQANKAICVAVNALFHQDRIGKVAPYLKALEAIKVDRVTIGDPGVIRILKKEAPTLKFVYDAQILVTSANQINFWVTRGAVGAVLAREVTYEELTIIRPQVHVPIEMLVYGATCIHQSKRPLVENYLNFIEEKEDTSKERGLFISEPKKEDTHYSIYEDINGTHIFADNDLNLMPELDKLMSNGFAQWKLEGIYTKGDTFVAIAELFVQAKAAFEAGKWTPELMETLNEQLIKLHPAERGLDEGFFVKNPGDVK